MIITTKDTQSEITVNPRVFSYDYNEGLIHQVIVATMNAMRSGNSAQKTRSEVSGGGKKPWRQKGTGRARAGTIRSPIWRGGGVTFASKKRDYSQKINKKMYKSSMRSIISELYRQERLIIVSSFSCESHKTKDFVKKMQQIGLEDALLVLDEVGVNEHLASRNLYHYSICDVESLDPLFLLHFKKVLITEQAVKSLEEWLQ